MYRLKKQFTYIENSTLTGKKLLVGIKDENSYLLIKKEYRDAFYSLMEKSDESQLSDKEKTLLNVFDQRGYLDNGKTIKASFNEYNQLVHVIAEKKINRPNLINIQNEKFFYISYFFSLMIGSYIWIKNCSLFMNMKWKLSDFTLYELAICIILLPLLINMTHEFAHFIAASCLGVQIDRIIIGFFVTWPTIFITYKGLNLQSTIKKVVIASAGISAHFINLIVGLLVYKYQQNIVIIIWIMANVGMITTNLLLIRPNDGYFIMTSLIGIYNLRYKGYRFIRKMLRREKAENSIEMVCGALLIVLWMISLAGIFMTVKYYTEILELNYKVVYVIAGGIVFWMTCGLINRIKHFNW